MDYLKRIPADKKVRMLLMIIVDAAIICLTCYLSLLLRFDLNPANIPIRFLTEAKALMPFTAISTIIVFMIFNLYFTIWSLASIREAIKIVLACLVAALVQVAESVLLIHSLPRSYFVFFFIILTVFTMIFRFSYRIYRTIVFKDKINSDTVNTIIVGAGEAGEKIIREIHSTDKANVHVCCIVDDDTNKIGKTVHGVRVEGTRYNLPELIKKYDVKRVILAMASSSPEERKGIIEIAQKAGIKDIKVLPGIYQLVDGTVTVSKLRNVDLLDLLGRDPVKVNLKEVGSYITDKVVLVTGGGGSIGSELCRQIAKQHPKKLVVFDIYENNVYDIQQELKVTHPELNAEYLIGSVRNTGRLDYIFRTYKPQIVFHAAAHKHVPLMEDSPTEAIKNNVMGTYKTAKKADEYGAEKFVLISTDKAVNPTNIMGASKRLCEMVVQMMSRHSKTDFVAVRFGNVLGSNGSVIPLFKKQIAAGGPVTVTDKRIIRFFMTIPEAVSLVLQAGAYAHGGEIFILDMGDPVKIDDMARNLIKLSGYEPDKDIKIVYTGLRPGEKLYEEMLMKEEGMKDTPNKLIHIGQPIIFDDDEFKQELATLDKVANENGDGNEMKKLVAKVVPTYHPDLKKEK
ncbi:UDP-N-acetylglucosamine 4,6-dehydratase [Intestinibaculum porci]|uniref:UDP-N-acetylglucosamine 4,6-dehydratase n=1 Tax=Intestinibaculum porci TaxID=2487118 RepID=A0A3G9JW95_9FIRM|nr:nucleoside-diphosphate sugar epimerase/dehydratase [Intestinibaculum porci]BBH27339.1 UDP-N-acetylglucosamine 4,6-dehydratase [Intestinibaculum porci]